MLYGDFFYFNICSHLKNICVPIVYIATAYTRELNFVIVEFMFCYI